MQQIPNPRKDNVYTGRRPYLIARGTHKRFDIPATAEGVEKSKAALLTADVNVAIDDGVSDIGSLALGGTTRKRSVTISTRTVDGPAAKKLTQVNAAQVRMAI